MSPSRFPLRPQCAGSLRFWTERPGLQYFVKVVTSFRATL